MHLSTTSKKNVHIVESASSEEGLLFAAAVEEILQAEDASKDRMVAFDCEGVNLSRLGTVEIVSLCFDTASSGHDGDDDAEGGSKKVFLVTLGKNPDSEIVQLLKDLFGSERVLKVIHDCRMDADALYHCGDNKIILKNIHDTSCFHHVIFGKEDRNLNDVLSANGLKSNAARDTSVYRRNPAFWATRPLTRQMIDWASSDVDKLLELASMQLAAVSEQGKIRAMAKSKANTTSARDMRVAKGMHVRNPGYFIGKGGMNLRSLQRRTGTLVYQMRPGDTWFVYYPTETALSAVKRKMEE